MKEKSASRGGTIIAGLKMLALSSVGLVASNAHADAIVNGSFESPDIAAPFAIAGPTGWNNIGPTLIFDTGGAGYPLPEDGAQYVGIGFVGTPNSISQTFSVATAGSYELNWYDNGQINSHYGYAISMVDDANLSLPIISTSYTGTGAAAWQHESVSLSLNVGNYTLGFTPKTGGVGTALDNVSLQESVRAPSVPDQGGTFALAAISAATLGLVRRRSR